MIARVGIFCCLAVLVELGLAQSIAVTELGGTCSATSQCAITNAECIDTKCQCKATYVQDGASTCIKTCTNNGDCTEMANLICVSNRCECPTITHVFVNGECLEVSNKFGSSCTTGPQCTNKWGDLAACRDGKCSCQESTVFDKDACYKQISLVGDKCRTESGAKERCYLDDDGDKQNVECAQGECKCKSGYIASQDKRKCTCQGDTGCTNAPNLFCRSGRCTCPADTHVAVEEECLPMSTRFGSSCKSGPQCTNKWGDLAACRDGKCSCQNEAVFDTLACSYKITQVGDNCNNTIGRQLCYLDDDGDNQHVECSGGECKCKSGYTATEDKRKCIIPVFGSPCTSGPQCTHLWGDLAICREGKCSCQDEAIFDKDACYFKITLVGDNCNTASKQRCYLDDDGDNQNVECVQGKCQCKSDYTASQDKRKCNAGVVHLVSISSLLLVVMAKIVS